MSTAAGSRAASGSSFYAGMRLLPPDRRAALFAVYALARQIDDIADGDLAADQKLAALERRAQRAHSDRRERRPGARRRGRCGFAVPDPARGVRRPDRRRGDGYARSHVRDVRRARAVLPLCRRLDRPPGARCLRLLGPRARLRARRRPRRCAPDRERASGCRRGRGERARLPAARRPRAFRRRGRRRPARRFRRPADRLRGATRARVARPRARPRPAPRPPQRLGRAGDGGQVPRAARPDRRRAVARVQRPALAAPLGEGARPRPQPGRSRAHEQAVGGRRRAWLGSRPRSSWRTRARR